MESDQDNERNLQESVERFRVCWEVGPNARIRMSARQATGFAKIQIERN